MMSISEQLPAIVILAPFFTAILVSFASLWRRNLAYPLTLAGLGISLVAACALLVEIAANGARFYDLGGWPAPIGIVFYVDTLNSIVLIVITAVALISAVASLGEIASKMPEKTGAFYALYLLFVVGVLGITLTGDAFNLYVLIEVASLTSYGLIAQGNKRAMLASLNYLFIGMVGACFYLLGVGYLLIKTGTLNMHDIHEQIRILGLMDSPSIHVGMALIMVGLMIKAAFFPLHGWLPNAYGYSPSSTANLIAPLMTKVMIYVMARMMLTVFGLDYCLSLPWADWIVPMASVGIVAGSLMALGQTDLRRMLSYLIVAEVGYMVGGLWMGNTIGMQGALYHIVADAAMTACLFIVVMMVVHKTGKRDRSAFEGLFARMPVTMALFVLGAFSLMGIPPTCGFFSKWYLIAGAMEAQRWEFAAALIASSLIAAILFFRIIEIALFGEKPAHGGGHHEEAHPVKISEAPLYMLLPAVLIAVSLPLIGLFNTQIIELISRTLVGAFLNFPTP
jgi:multicomponent Na+:H+ antiporter subunit D